MKKKSKKIKRIEFSIAIIFFIAVGFILLNSQKAPQTGNPSLSNTANSEVIQNYTHGTLAFTNYDKKQKASINIEIADNPQAHLTGLMHRKSMPNDCGMLFIYQQAGPKSFWMKNTHIPLDIIFVDPNFEILHIAKNAVPFSQESILCEKNILYVVEVNAGFTDEYSINTGDMIYW